MDELERQLGEALKPVSAPAALWPLVEASLPQRGRPSWGAGARLAVAATLAVLAMGGVLYVRGLEREPTLREFALEMHGHAAGVPGAVEGPVREVVALRVSGQPATVVAFHLEGMNATLVSSAAGAAAAQRGAKIVSESRAGERLVVFEWQSRGQSFALVTEARLGRRACRLCHSA